MRPEYILPVILILIQIGASVVYAIKSDYWLALYWIAAAVLNFAVTFKP